MAWLVWSVQSSSRVIGGDSADPECGRQVRQVIRSLVSDSVFDMRTNGEPIPMPFGDRSYSGKFIVRVPPETHRALAIRAAEQGVSMNRLVSARLARER